MQRTLRINLVLLLSMMVSVTAFSQVRHVTTCNPLSRNNSSYMEVYEYDYVDVQPQFPGGEHGLLNYINKTREYPYHAYKNRVEGRVLCSFVVGTDGRVCNIQIIRGAGDESLDREAMRVISKMPRWKVGRINNTAVAVRCVLPIAFRL
jgi:protein TonB